MNPSSNPSALRSKNEITAALFKLLKQYPYTEITVKQIVLEAEVVRKTFYRNFNSKDDVLDAYISNIMNDYVHTLQNLINCGMPNILDVIFDFCTDNKELLFILRENHLLHILLNKWNTFIPAVHNQITSEDSLFFRTYGELNTEYILAFNIGAVWNILVKWIENDMQDSINEIKNTIVGYLKNINLFI